MPDHDCAGAECPQCAPLPVGRTVFNPDWKPPGHLPFSEWMQTHVRRNATEEAQRREAALQRLQGTSPQYPVISFPMQPTLHPVVLSPEEIRQQYALSTFRDSRGQAVPQWPSAVVPSATTIVVHGSHWRESGFPWNIVVHQRRDNQWWGIPGGKMEPGESILECAQREAREETGLEVRIEQLVSVDSSPSEYAICVYPDGNIVHYCNLTFIATVISGVLRSSEESLHVCWAKTDALPEPFLPSQKWRLEQALALRQSVAVR